MSEQRVTLNLDMTGFAAAIRKAAASVHRFQLALMRPAKRRVHRRRCRICTPFANPAPLSIDGHAYNRRRKSSNRRNR